ncbi:MAG: recombinase family protein [Geodermatophilaceae bacterium]
MTTRRAAIYCRISQDREGAGLGVDRQRKDCEALAGKMGWTIVATHTDNDLSAYSGKPRPGYRALLADLEGGRADSVLVWHTDRLHRSPRELEEYVDLCERHKVVTQTCKAGELDLATPSGRAVARTLGAWARFEVEHKSERTKTAQLQAAAAGRWLGGGRPFGWNVHEDGSALLNRSEAREVRNATKAVLAGASLGSIITDWNNRGVLTSTGRRWSYSTARQLLARPRNAGLSTYNGEIVGKSTWPPLVTEDTWRSVVALLEDPDRRTSTSNRVKWLLVGIGICGTCGETIRSAAVISNRAKGTSRTIYRCATTEPRRQSGKPAHVARAAMPLDELVHGVMVERLSRPDALDLFLSDPGHDAEGLRVEAVALRMRLGEAADSFAEGAITKAQLERATARIRDRLSEVEAVMTRQSRGGPLASLAGAADPAKQWRKIGLDRQRAILSDLVTITILPSGKRGKAFDPDLIHFEWRRP